MSLPGSLFTGAGVFSFLKEQLLAFRLARAAVTGQLPASFIDRLQLHGKIQVNGLTGKTHQQDHRMKKSTSKAHGTEGMLTFFFQVCSFWISVS